MSRVATRLLSLIMLMQTRSMWKACDLAQELEVSERTVHRYMTMLDELGMPIYSERGPHGGYGLLRGYKLPPLVFTPEEATVLYMGAQMIRDLLGRTYQDAVVGATAKLDNVLPDDLRDQVANMLKRLVIGGLTALDYRPYHATIDLLRQCLQHKRQVRIAYRGAQAAPTLRTVDPYALTLQWGLWYLVAYCHLRQELRTFRVDRILETTATEQPYQVAPTFDLPVYLEQMARYERPHEVVVRINARLAPRISDQYGHWMQIERADDGSATARFQAGELDWAIGWVLSLGGEARAIAPPELARRIRQAAESVLASLADEQRSAAQT